MLCKFVRGAFGDLFEESGEILSAVTGTGWSAADVASVARRIVDLRRLGNERFGWRPEDDGLPRRFLEEPLASGPAIGARLPAERLSEMIRGYNRARGYEDAGYVPRARRDELEAELGLDFGEAARD